MTSIRPNPRKHKNPVCFAPLKHNNNNFSKHFNFKLFHSGDSSRVSVCTFFFYSTSPPVSTTTSPPFAGSLTLLHTIVAAYEIPCSNICMKCLKKLVKTTFFFQCDSTLSLPFFISPFYLAFVSRLCISPSITLSFFFHLRA